MSESSSALGKDDVSRETFPSFFLENLFSKRVKFYRGTVVSQRCNWGIS
jgi:hypothetical protein